MKAVREETFGPLVAIVRVKDAEEAVRIANDSPFGLNATVFGPEAIAREVAERLESGNVVVNDVLVHYLVVEAPLGGVKSSGLGVRHGVEGMRQWTRLTAVTTSWLPLAPVGRLIAAHLAFPYDRRVLGLFRRASRVLYGTGWKRKFGPLPGAPP
jgi:delta 1-pyrroline-5-carboxylate dehydrogenase